jgi:hypothetical protein
MSSGGLGIHGVEPSGSAARETEVNVHDAIIAIRPVFIII